MCALPLAWRAFGAMWIHSSSRASVFWRSDSAFCSCRSFSCFCASHEEWFPCHGIPAPRSSSKVQPAVWQGLGWGQIL